MSRWSNRWNQNRWLEDKKIKISDNTTLIATTKEGQVYLLGNVKEMSEKFRLFLNLEKTKVKMQTSHQMGGWSKGSSWGKNQTNER